MSDRRMRILPSQAIWYLANQYEQNVQVLFEYVENALDARARDIWVVLAEEFHAIIDDGHGMNGEMDPDQAALLHYYLDEAAAGRLSEDDDISELITSESHCTLQWLMEGVTASAKKYVEGQHVRGVKGIGALAFRQIGNRAQWRSLPSINVSPNPPAMPYIVEPPSNEELIAGSLEYSKIVLSEDPLTDPFGNRLAHGTEVVIYDLIEGVERSLWPAFVADKLGQRFGSDIRDRGVTISVVDRVTNEGKKHSGGKIYVVDAPPYEGIALNIPEQGFLRKGRGPFKLQLYYDPEGKKLSVMLRRKGSDLRPIQELPEFDNKFFNSGKITGFIEYPDLPESEAPWHSDKMTPRDGPVRNQWAKSVLRLVEEASKAVEEIEAFEEKAALDEFAEDFSEAVLAAMSEDPWLRDQLKHSLRLPKPRTRRRRGPNVNPTEYTVVQVRDEHGMPCRGIGVALYPFVGDENPIVVRKTGQSGQVSVGVLETGDYRVQIHNLQGASCPRGTSQVFRISGDNPRQTLKFELITGRPSPKENQLPGFRIYPHNLSDPGQPFRTDRLLDAGLFEINTLYEPFRRALDEGDELGLVTLVANMLSIGIPNCVLEGQDQSDIVLAQVKLFSHAFENMRPSRRRKWQRRK